MGLPPRITLNRSDDKNDQAGAGSARQPMFGRFRRDIEVEPLAGSSAVPAILRPIELSRVPDQVHTFNEATVAMRHCVHLCTLLDNQKDVLKNTYCLRVALIQDLFTRVVPLPLPHKHPQRKEQCLWEEPMRYVLMMRKFTNFENKCLPYLP
jgi:hypothetical protein